jgi:ATP-dependent protease ClpP protease subunit
MVRIRFERRLGPKMAKVFKAALESNQGVEIRINTPGGDWNTCKAIIQVLKKMNERGLVTKAIVTGRAYSAGFAILQYCEERVALAGTRFCYHPPHGPGEMFGFKAEMFYGTDPHYNLLIKHMSRRTGLSSDQIFWWGMDEKRFTDKEALEYKFIDRIVRS